MLLRCAALTFMLVSGCTAKDSSRHYFERGLAQAARDDVEAALGSFEMAVQLQPDFTDALFNLSALLHAKGDTEAAAATLARVLSLEPRHAEALNALGLIQEQKGNAREAITNFEQALKIKPAFPEARHNLAMALLSAGEFARALRECRIAVAAQPNRAEWKISLARIYERLGQLRSAIETHLDALRIAPGAAVAHYRLAQLLTDQTSEAMAHFRAAVKHDPANISYRYALARALRGAGDASGSQAEFGEIKRLTDRQRTFELAAAANAEGIKEAAKDEWSSAAASFRKALEYNPESADAHYNLGGVLLKKGDGDAALAEFRRTVELNPAFVDAHEQSAALLAAKQDWRAAAGQYEALLRLRPGRLQSRYALVEVLQKISDHASVARELEECLLLDPGNAAAHYNLGVALLLGGGDRTRAVEELRMAVSLKPDYEEALRALASLNPSP